MHCTQGAEVPATLEAALVAADGPGLRLPPCPDSCVVCPRCEASLKKMLADARQKERAAHERAASALRSELDGARAATAGVRAKLEAARAKLRAKRASLRTAKGRLREARADLQRVRERPRCEVGVQTSEAPPPPPRRDACMQTAAAPPPPRCDAGVQTEACDDEAGYLSDEAAGGDLNAAECQSGAPACHESSASSYSSSSLSESSSSGSGGAAPAAAMAQAGAGARPVHARAADRGPAAAGAEQVAASHPPAAAAGGAAAAPSTGQQGAGATVCDNARACGGPAADAQPAAAQAPLPERAVTPPLLAASESLRTSAESSVLTPSTIGSGRAKRGGAGAAAPPAQAAGRASASAAPTCQEPAPGAPPSPGSVAKTQAQCMQGGRGASAAATLAAVLGHSEPLPAVPQYPDMTDSAGLFHREHGSDRSPAAAGDVGDTAASPAAVALSGPSSAAAAGSVTHDTEVRGAMPGGSSLSNGAAPGADALMSPMMAAHVLKVDAQTLTMLFELRRAEADVVAGRRVTPMVPGLDALEDAPAADGGHTTASGVSREPVASARSPPQAERGPGPVGAPAAAAAVPRQRAAAGAALQGPQHVREGAGDSEAVARGRGGEAWSPPTKLGPGDLEPAASPFTHAAAAVASRGAAARLRGTGWTKRRGRAVSSSCGDTDADAAEASTGKSGRRRATAGARQQAAAQARDGGA